MKRIVTGLAILLALALLAFVTVVAPIADRRMNRVSSSGTPAGETARALHRAAFVADLHADALLWPRDLNDRHGNGHVDLPRLQEGNVALQVFSVVTKTPRGLNYERNDANTDNITLLALAERYPMRAWRSLFERARWQGQRFHRMTAASGGALALVASRADLERLLSQRPGRPTLTGGILATEGLHPLEGQLAKLDTLFADGFRIFGLTHFFDNEVGASAHGVSRGGLTAFGDSVIARIEELGAIVDLAHTSPQLFDDVMARATRPIMVSHTGVQGTCPGPRNLSDEQLRRVAAAGGLVGIGFWDGAICETTPAAFARAVRHALEVGGDDYVALGSDFDGATTTPFDAAGLASATEALLNAWLTREQVLKVLGGNALRFLRANLPP